MDLAIALGQALGLGVAAGLAALLPLAVGAVAAVLGFAPGAIGRYDDTVVVAAAWIAGVVESIFSLLVPALTRAVLGAVGGGVAGYFVATDELALAPVIGGALLGAAATFVAAKLVEGALSGEGERSGLTIITALAAIGVAAIAIVPFVGYLLVVALGWLGFRQRRAAQRKFAGLRILK